jgi:hypothetical protein
MPSDSAFATSPANMQLIKVQMNYFSGLVIPGRQAGTSLFVVMLCALVIGCGGGSGQQPDDALARSRVLAFNQSPLRSASGATVAADTAASTPVTPPIIPPPRIPSGGRQLLDEIVRLEREGVLLILDRGTDIAGLDVNNNGVRDDIDVYIAALPITDIQKKVVMQRARVQQAKLLLDPTNKQAIKASSEQSMAAAHCMGIRFDDDNLSARVEAITANTPERGKRYLRYMAALNGTSVWGATGNTCEP